MKVWQIAKSKEGKYIATLLTPKGAAQETSFSSPSELLHFLREEKKEGEIKITKEPQLPLGIP